MTISVKCMEKKIHTIDFIYKDLISAQKMQKIMELLQNSANAN